MESKERREQERQAAAAVGAKVASSSTTSLMSSISNNSILARSLPPNATDAGRFGHPSSSNPFLPSSSSSSIGMSTPNPGANPMMYFEHDDNDDDSDDEDDDEDVPRLVMNADSTGDPEIKVD